MLRAVPLRSVRVRFVGMSNLPVLQKKDADVGLLGIENRGWVMNITV
jgi:hypothetical protein